MGLFAVRWATVLAAVGAVGMLVAAPPVWAASGDGPGLRVGGDRLASSLRCSGDLADSGPAPVLLIHGTLLDPDVNFDWNYEPALDRLDRPYCTVRLPGHGMGDIQVAAEYVVHAIRTMHSRAHRRIDLVGFSQGGMIGRWALKFWPDTRTDIDDYVSIDGSNHGTLDAYPVCAAGCAPGIRQQQTGSRFLSALNDDGETYAGISYTQIYTVTDEVVFPNLPPAPSTALHTGHGEIRNIAVQQICPVHVAEHLSMGTTDPVGYALVLDAITHGGPANPARIDPSVCTRALMPGVNALTLPLNEARVGAEIATTLATYPHTSAEPPLADYAADRS